MKTNDAYDIEEGFSMEDGVLHLALRNTVGCSSNENAIFSFYIHEHDYIPGYYKGFVNDSISDFRIIRNDTMQEVGPIPNMYHPYNRSCFIHWNPPLISALYKFLSNNSPGGEILALLTKITACHMQ